MTSSIRGRVALVSSVIFLLFFVVLLGSSVRAGAAPYAAIVMDARTGEVIYSQNADTRLHPASLTKMMTLYIAFEAIEHGEIGLDSRVTISKNAANEEPSKLGLRAGQQIELRYLIRAAAVKSANDAATAIGEAISGSEGEFAKRMNRTAKALGMTRSTFVNANGLTTPGHLSTARDMTVLGRHLFYDYPAYYNLFGRTSTDAGVGTVYSTNRKFLASYKGADGIKTGYTNAAGSNIVASAERGNTRIIATIFGGTSAAARNAKAAELLDLGFRKAPKRVAVNAPRLPAYLGNGGAVGGAKTVRVAAVAAVPDSSRPEQRPGEADTGQTTFKSGIEAAIAMATTDGSDDTSVALAADESGGAAPKARPPRVNFAAAQPVAAPSSDLVVVSRASTSGGRQWGISVGAYASRFKAEQVLLKTALNEISTLDGALRKVARSPKGYDARFVGMSREQAALVCRRLEARGAECTTFGPSGS